MIRYALVCPAGHEFESWFRRSEDFDLQSRRGLLNCPVCGAANIEKRPMAPALVKGKTRKRADRGPDASRHPGSQSEILKKVRAFKHSVLANSEDVGPRFADEARKIHSGEADERNIVGEATAEEAQSLVEEGIPFGVLPKLPEEHN